MEGRCLAQARDTPFLGGSCSCEISVLFATQKAELRPRQTGKAASPSLPYGSVSSDGHSCELRGVLGKLSGTSVQHLSRVTHGLLKSQDSQSAQHEG